MKRISARQYALTLADVLTEATAKQRPLIIQKFLARLQRQRQSRLLPRIVTQLEAELQRRDGIVPVLLETAQPAPAMLEKNLQKRVGAPVALTATVSPALVAGARLTIGETCYDGSLRGLLTQLRTTLTS